MRVFVLCTGRNGSASLYYACQHITNYTCGHESLKSKLGEHRFDYSENHIEVDNRLTWFLGTVEKRFGDDAFYVHLHREKQKTAQSFARRFDFPGSIIRAFVEGVKHRRVEEMTEKEKHQASTDYIDAITDNVDVFLKNKSRKMDFHIEAYEEDFKKFWDFIGAEGDYEKALAEFSKVHNAHSDRRFTIFQYNLKSYLYRLKRLVSR